MRSYLACDPPAGLASCAAARRVQDCDSRLPVLVWQRPGLPGQRLSDNCVLPTLEQSLSVERAAVLETGPLLLQDHKSGAVPPISDYVGCRMASFRRLLKTFLFRQ